MSQWTNRFSEMLAGKPATRRGWPCELWEAYHGPAEDFAGILVTRRGSINHVVAWVTSPAMDLVVPDDEVAAELPKMLRAACWVASGPAGERRSKWALNLTVYAKSDSECPMPAEVYAFTCWPLGAEQRGPSAHPTPYCRFRFAAMVSQRVEMSFDEDDRAKYPVHTVGIADRDQGSGIDVNVEAPQVTAVPPAAWRASAGLCGAKRRGEARRSDIAGPENDPRPVQPSTPVHVVGKVLAGKPAGG